MFVQTIEGIDLEQPPPEKKLKKSQCTPLFMCAYTMRNAGAVIHTHSKVAVMATLLFPGKEFKCTHLEMIKGIKNQKTAKNFRYDEELIVPIIENTPFEEDLKDRLAETIENYPHTCAVLVRRHGVSFSYIRSIPEYRLVMEEFLFLRKFFSQNHCVQTR